MYGETEHFDLSTECACVNREIGILCGDSLHMTVRRWRSVNSEKRPCFLRGTSIQPKGVGPDALDSETMNISLETRNQRLHKKLASPSSHLQEYLHLTLERMLSSW